MAMDLNRTGFTTPIVGTASFKVEVDANGNLVTATGSQTAAGSKRISFNNIAATSNATSIAAVSTAFLSTLPGENKEVTPDTTATTMTVKWEAA